MKVSRANIYVDGFNLYYGALKSTPYKWLNLVELCRLVLLRYHVSEIKYFTARVKSRPSDPDQHVRQQVYFRALQTIPNVTIIEGHFLTKACRMPLETPIGTKRTVTVIKTEEKGSDVNLAAHLINDGYKGSYDIAVLITNDSDLNEAVRIVRSDLGLDVGIFNPHRNNPSVVLRQSGTFFRPIRPGVLAASQFPAVMSDAKGTFHKPTAW